MAFGNLLKLVAVALAAGAVGLGLGVGASKLSDAGQSGGSSTSGAASGSTVAAGGSVTGPLGSQRALALVRVRIVSAVLHPAATAYGKQRQRARLILRIRARNTGPSLVTPARPALLAAGVSVHTDPHAETPTTRLGPLASGSTTDVMLRFEVSGAVTQELTANRRVKLMVLGRALAVTIAVGPAVKPV